jgi:uncharacterized protein DUF4154
VYLSALLSQHTIKYIILLVILLGFLWPVTGHSSEIERASQIKAGFMYKFLFFTQWPEEAFGNDSDTITIAIVGHDPFGDIFNTIEGKIIDGRRLTINRYEKPPSIQSLKKCQLVFFSPSLNKEISSIIKALGDYPVVTVGDSEGFFRSGGMINFIIVENRVTFEVNVLAAKRAGIDFRSKLLRVANRIVGRQNGQ